MVLRRVIEHATTQNWLAIGIDFLIVVFGVFVGTQVSNWNSARLVAEGDAALIQQMQREFVVLRGDLAVASERATAVVVGTESVLAALRAGVPPPDTPEWRADLCNASFVFFLPREPPAFEALKETGALSRITDSELRVALTAYGQQSSEFSSIFPVVLAAISEPSSNYYQAVSFAQNVGDWAPDNANCVTSYDWEGLQRSRGELQAWMAGQADVLARGSGQLDSVDAILRLLDERTAPTDTQDSDPGDAQPTDPVP